MPVKKFIRQYLRLPDVPPTHPKSVSFESVQTESQEGEGICVSLVSVYTTSYVRGW